MGHASASLLARLLCTMDDIHPTRKGIFSMDTYGARVATGSKDSTVALAILRPTGLSCDGWGTPCTFFVIFFFCQRSNLLLSTSHLRDKRVRAGDHPPRTLS